MIKFLRRITFFLSMLILFQIFYPISDKAFAEASGTELQGNPLQSKLKIEFQAFPAQGIRAVVKDKLAFVTAGLAGLFVADIQDPANLRQLVYLELPEAVSLIGIYGSYIYLPAKNNLYIVNISDPLQPFYTIEAPMYSSKLLVSITADSNRMYLATEKSITVFSLEDPAKPLFLVAFRPDSPDETFIISDVAVRNGTAYVAMKEKGIVMYSFSEIDNIVHIGRYSSSSGYCANIDFYGNYAWLSIPDKKHVEILNISNIDRPKYSGVIKAINEIICVDGNMAYAVNSLGLLSIIDLSGFIPSTGVKAAEKKSENQKTAYITIDDGPTKGITAMNLDTLKKYGVKATFFVLPRDNGMEDIYKRFINEGHVIGNHSYSHIYDYLYGSIEYFKKDVLKAGDLIYKMLGYNSTVFRFPGGSMGRSKNIIKERLDILTELGYKYFDWDVTTGDTDPRVTKYKNEDYIVNLLADNVLKNSKDRKKLIILMHDSAGKIYTAKALPKIIEGLHKQGYVFDVLTNY